MATFLMRNGIEKGKKHRMWCLPNEVDPRSVTAAFVEEVEVVPPREEWQKDTPPEPVKMSCLTEL